MLPKENHFGVEHEFGLKEPALWVADLVAGAVRAHRLGDTTHREVLGDRVCEITIVTDC